MNLRSASNRQQTLLRKLNRKKYRQKEQLFLIEGARAVQQVLANKSVKIKALFFDNSQQYWFQSQWREAAQNLDSFTLTEDLFAEVSDTDTPQGVLAMCRMPNEITAEELASQSGIIVALDAVQDPGNLGTIIRTASWFGAAGLLSGKGTVDLFHPKVVRGTAGAMGAIPHCNGNLSDLLDTLESAGWSIFLLDAGADAKSISEVTSTEKTVIVVGNEAHGVDAALITKDRTAVRIPSPHKQPAVESLNVAVATSIALYDFSRK